MRSICFLSFGLLLVCSAVAGDPVNPFPREVIVSPAIQRWDFTKSTEGWNSVHGCSLAAKDGHMIVNSEGPDPYLAVRVKFSAGGVVARVRMRSDSDGQGQFFWSSTKNPQTSADRVVSFYPKHDGRWHEYEVFFQAEADLTTLRFDPCTAAGKVDVDWISLHAGQKHPLEIVEVNQTDQSVITAVQNHDNKPIVVTLNGNTKEIAALSTLNFITTKTGSLKAESIEIQSDDLPAIKRTIWSFTPQTDFPSTDLQHGKYTLRAADDGSQVQILVGDQLVAALAPLVHINHQLPKLERRTDAWPLVYEGKGVSAQLDAAANGEIAVKIKSDEPTEGPVLRVYGDLQQGLLAGVEHLGKGESSSSKLDIETDEHLRVEPSPMDLTMPLAVVVTSQNAVGLLWDDPSLQPTFASPDFLDGSDSHRVSLKGKNITAKIRFQDGWDNGQRLEDLVLWAVRSRGLPEVAKTPRGFEQQMQFSLQGYRHLLFDSETGGWFHAVVPGVRTSPAEGKPFADHVSAIWRASGKMPDAANLQFGGAHVSDPSSFFATGQAEQWLQIAKQQCENLIRQQRPDGSFRYGGKFRRGHFEDTSSGTCARPAKQLMEFAWYTGDQRALDAGLRALEFLKRFRTPRGAQTWEVPLHTPDILASAEALWAHTIAFKITGDRAHLAEARRWAISGLPFIYQWSNRPIMIYATTPVLGATNWKAPNWIGLPVQWCGTVYARALLDFAPHDDTLDWRKIAKGITIAAEQMQYTDGRSIGTLPDVFKLSDQIRAPADINPSVVIGLRMMLEGKPYGLSVAVNEKHRILAPFPVKIENNIATVSAVAGQNYQVIIDGKQIRDIQSIGTDEIQLP